MDKFALSGSAQDPEKYAEDMLHILDGRADLQMPDATKSAAWQGWAQPGSIGANIADAWRGSDKGQLARGAVTGGVSGLADAAKSGLSSVGKSIGGAFNGFGQGAADAWTGMGASLQRPGSGAIPAGGATGGAPQAAPRAAPKAAPASPSNVPKGQYETIGQGQTLSGIAKQRGMSMQDLLAANPQIADPNKIQAGAKINMNTQGLTGGQKTLAGSQIAKHPFKAPAPAAPPAASLMAGGRPRAGYNWGSTPTLQNPMAPKMGAEKVEMPSLERHDKSEPHLILTHAPPTGPQESEEAFRARMISKYDLANVAKRARAKKTDSASPETASEKAAMSLLDLFNTAKKDPSKIPVPKHLSPMQAATYSRHYVELANKDPETRSYAMRGMRNILSAAKKIKAGPPMPKAAAATEKTAISEGYLKGLAMRSPEMWEKLEKKPSLMKRLAPSAGFQIGGKHLDEMGDRFGRLATAAVRASTPEHGAFLGKNFGEAVNKRELLVRAMKAKAEMFKEKAYGALAKKTLSKKAGFAGHDKGGSGLSTAGLVTTKEALFGARARRAAAQRENDDVLHEMSNKEVAMHGGLRGGLGGLLAGGIAGAVHRSEGGSGLSTAGLVGGGTLLGTGVGAGAALLRKNYIKAKRQAEAKRTEQPMPKAAALEKTALGGEMFKRLVSSTPDWKSLGDAAGAGHGVMGRPSKTLDKMTDLLKREASGGVKRMIGESPAISHGRETLHDVLRGAAKRKAYSVSGKLIGLKQTLRESGDALGKTAAAAELIKKAGLAGHDKGDGKNFGNALRKMILAKTAYHDWGGSMFENDPKKRIINTGIGALQEYTERAKERHERQAEAHEQEMEAKRIEHMKRHNPKAYRAHVREEAEADETERRSVSADSLLDEVKRNPGRFGVKGKSSLPSTLTGLGIGGALGAGMGYSLGDPIERVPRSMFFALAGGSLGGILGAFHGAERKQRGAEENLKTLTGHGPMSFSGLPEHIQNKLLSKHIRKEY